MGGDERKVVFGFGTKKGSNLSAQLQSIEILQLASGIIILSKNGSAMAQW